MNSYELLRPDGTPSGVWACGNCHRTHAQTTRNQKPVSEANRESAENCCVPRNCGYCGRPAPRDALGNYLSVHPECIPPCPPPHPSMANPWARLLARRMSDISEECYAAGWLIGNEYTLWRILQGESPRYGRCELSAEELEELRILSETAEGWIWTAGEGSRGARLVSFAEWEALLATAEREIEREYGPAKDSESE